MDSEETAFVKMWVSLFYNQLHSKCHLILMCCMYLEKPPQLCSQAT